MTATSFLELPGKRLAYALSDGQGPCVVFLGGFKSDMTGGKATALEAFCKKRGQRFLRFDYTGHGQSSDEFIHGTIGRWKQDALDAIDHLTEGELILVGSSMGAWLAFLAALERRERVQALVGIASAPDFTERCIRPRLTPEQKQELKERGVFYAPACHGEAPYPITRQMMEEARHHLLLKGQEIPLDVPVRLIHGLKDDDAPWHVCLTLIDLLRTKDVRLHLIKDGHHRLSEPENLALICQTVEQFFIPSPF